MTALKLRIAGCELCEALPEPIWSNADYAVILVDDGAYPGFVRVIWRDHMREMSDLSESQRLTIHAAVHQVELALRAVMAPDKINLASLGNVVPHLHWHIIARYHDDATFPAPIWATPARTTDEAVLNARRALLPQLRAALLRRFEETAS
jgi:diadenosine tetraphosphate (Ap4A) HIT family hydrolase